MADHPNKPTTFRARIRFSKTGVMRFVGHLDMMRYFQKAIRRAKLPIAYSGGFHPHQILSFALPLGVGVTSAGEYMDIELTERVEPDAAITALQAQMADGVTIDTFVYPAASAKKAMAAVEAASYEVRIGGLLDTASKKSLSIADIKTGIGHFYHDAPEIRITKKTKKSERQLDLKPLIEAFDVAPDTAGNPVFFLTLSAGSTDNIKPELVFTHFLPYFGLSEDSCRLSIHRLDLLTRDADGRLVSLGDV